MNKFLYDPTYSTIIVGLDDLFLAILPIQAEKIDV